MKENAVSGRSEDVKLDIDRCVWHGWSSLPRAVCGGRLFYIFSSDEELRRLLLHRQA
jgi:hypothetical protein